VSCLHLRGLTCNALEPVELEVGPGECVALSGPSGSGKTLLLRAVADLDPHEGAALLDGDAQADLPAPTWRRWVGLLAAESAWWGEHVRDHFPAGADELLDALGLPAACLDWTLARLSSGERQRLALARLLSGAPRALLLDEPTANLDAANIRRVEALVEHYRIAQQAPVLWVSHDSAQRQRVASRHLCIRERRLVEEVPCL
jgi:ABC-type iron transport system FetAB ATPase subunit